MKITKTTVPPSVRAAEYLPADYSDCFRCAFSSDRDMAPDDIMTAIWTEQPRLIRFMFILRNALVRPFGLDGPKRDDNPIAGVVRSGEPFKNISLPCKSDSEVILCIDDRHLRAYLSVAAYNGADGTKGLAVTTVVNFNNRFGRFYFAVIRPFHGAIVKGTLKYILKSRGAV